MRFKGLLDSPWAFYQPASHALEVLCKAFEGFRAKNFSFFPPTCRRSFFFLFFSPSFLPLFPRASSIIISGENAFWFKVRLEKWAFQIPSEILFDFLTFRILIFLPLSFLRFVQFRAGIFLGLKQATSATFFFSPPRFRIILF